MVRYAAMKWPSALVPLAAFAVALTATSPPAYALESRAVSQPPMVSRGIYLTRDFRNPTFAAVASMAFPGGGQVYNDDLGKFVGIVLGLGLPATLYLVTPDLTLRIVAVSGFGLVYLWSIGDAYLSATILNERLEQLAMP